LIMTTNHKERLDPALLRPGRTDAMFELSLSSKSQIERLFIRFFKDEELAKRFSSLVPEKTFSMSQLQGFFVKYKKNPKLIVENVR
jgi:chaperone BCS1